MKDTLGKGAHFIVSWSLAFNPSLVFCPQYLGWATSLDFLLSPHLEVLFAFAFICPNQAHVPQQTQEYHIALVEGIVRNQAATLERQILKEVYGSKSF